MVITEVFSSIYATIADAVLPPKDARKLSSIASLKITSTIALPSRNFPLNITDPAPGFKAEFISILRK